jgi:glyoxylase-like metal-dependent hydrolase (beta-lactamase superfamily II)
MRFSSIEGNRLKLDGGGMFGNAPKAVWSRWIKPDDLNRIELAGRALLVESGDHKILFETGIGAYMPPDLKKRFGVCEVGHTLLDSLAVSGIRHEEITAIVLSHLHFDHAGGLLTPWQAEYEPELLFPGAQFHVSAAAWKRACTPHLRDKASFVPALNRCLEASGRLNLISADTILHFNNFDVHFFESQGHTPGMICSDLRWDHGRLVFAADLIPGTPWIHLPITMGYDRFPEKLIDEKKELLASFTENEAWLFFTHDPNIALSKINYDSRNLRFSAAETCDAITQESL